MPENGCLDLTNQRINLRAVKTKPFQVSFNQIEHLKLGFNNLENEGTTLIAEMMGSCCNIVSVDLGFNAVGDVGACALGEKLSGHQSLTTLYLSGNNISEVGCTSIAGIIRHSSVLRCLHLAGNRIRAIGARELALSMQQAKALVSLDISSCDICPEGFVYIAKALLSCQTLRHLNLGNNKGGDSGIKSLAQAMAQNRHLEVLDISFNEVTYDGSDALAESLSEYTNLKSLSMGNNKLGDASVDGIVAILRSTHLEELHVGFSKIGAGGTQAIIKAIADCPNLGQGPCVRKLTLSGNTMNTEGARVVAGVLGRPGGCTLRELHIDQMNFGQAGKRDIAVSIATNRDCALEAISGISLGPLMIELGSPPQLAKFSNIQVLSYIRAMWSGQGAPASSTAVPSKNQGLTSETSAQSMEEERLPSSCVVSSEKSLRQPLVRGSTVLSSSADCLKKKRQLGEGSPKIPSRESSGSTADLTDLATDVSRAHIKRNLSELSPSLSSDDETGDDGRVCVDEYDRTDSSISTNASGGESAAVAPSSTITPEQIDIVSKQLEQMFEPLLQEITDMPFDPSNLWMLHQHYFSPHSPNDKEDPGTQQHQSSIPSGRDDASRVVESTGMEEEEKSVSVFGGESRSLLGKHLQEQEQQHHQQQQHHTHSSEKRPTKKRGNRHTMTRIAEYPKIQYRLECLKLDSNQAAILTLLRQLRCVEEYIDTYKSKYPMFSLINVESILLDANGLEKLT